MNAVEVMSCGHTSADVVDGTVGLLKDAGLNALRLPRGSIGVIFNRLWAAIKREALVVAAEGVATHQDIDEIFCEVLKSPRGPFRIMDEAGLDTILNIERHYLADNPHLPRNGGELLAHLVDAGRLGMKTASGFYD